MYKFALSATDAAFDLFRFNDLGQFKDSAFKLFRNGGMETTVSLKVRDAAAGAGSLLLTGNYAELSGVAAPAPPSAGLARLFLNSANGEVSARKPDGTVVSLEGGGGGGGGGGSPSGTAAGDLGGSYPSPTVQGVQGRAVSAAHPANGDCLGWNELTAHWEPGPCAVVRAALTWHFPGSPAAGAQAMLLEIPDGMSGAFLKEVRVVVSAPGTTATTFNIERCITGCLGTAPVFAPIYSTARTLSPATKTALGGVPDSAAVNAGDQFRVNLVSVGAGLSGVTVMLVFEHNAFAMLEGQYGVDCQSYCGALWAAAGIPPNPFGKPAKLGDACLCFGPESPSRAG